MPSHFAIASMRCQWTIPSVCLLTGSTRWGARDQLAGALSFSLWTTGFAAYQRRRSSLICWICSGSDVPLRPKFMTPKKCIGSNARHDSLVDAMKNVDHHVFPTQPRSFHPHWHLLSLLTQFMRPRLVRPYCCTVGWLLCTTSLESLCWLWKASTCCRSRCFG